MLINSDESKETYTCKCGNQTWYIFGNEIECDECGEVYNMFLRPWKFNLQAREAK